MPLVALVNGLVPLWYGIGVGCARALTDCIGLDLDWAQVDDLEEIGDLERYIDLSAHILVYCSRGYFKSKNCMRELIAATTKGKPVVALLEPDASRGGLTLDEIRERLDEAERHYFGKWDLMGSPSAGMLYAHLFRRPPIEWNRYARTPLCHT